MESLVKSVDFLSKAGFLRGVVSKKKNRIGKIEFLPLGTALLENIRNAWHRTKEDFNSYPAIGVEQTCSGERFSFASDKSLRENFLHVKKNFQNELPLIIKSVNHYHSGGSPDDGILQTDIPQGTILATNYFFTPSMALEKFYHIQRERKICWMRYSSNPSRYYLSDMVTEARAGHKLQSVKIKSKLGVGDMEVEEIHFVPMAAMSLENETDFAMKDPWLGKDVLPTCIRSEFKLENTACALLFDSVEDSRQNSLALNRKLAPYQCGIFCHFNSDKTINDLTDLSTHISNVIRKIGISALNLRKCHSDNWTTLNNELTQMDRIGVPYCIILESDTLRTGLMKFRSRDTTLSETIHITDVSNYLQKIFNS